MHGEEFSIGRCVLQPRRQLLIDGVPATVGRKALELLSVLAEAKGALVTKDELMAAVWPNAIVEDNAVQAQITALRKTLGDDGALLSTVRGLGYRLVAEARTVVPPAVADRSPSEPSSKPSIADDHAAPARRRGPSGFERAWMVAIPVVVASVAAFAHFAGLWLPAPAHRDERVAVLRFETSASDRGAKTLADGLHGEIAGALANSQVVTLSGANPQAPSGPHDAAQAGRLGATLAVEGEVRSDGPALDVQVRLEDAKEHVTLWSDEIKGPVAKSAALRTAAAARIADAVSWARVGRSGPTRLDADSLASFIAGRESLTGVRHPDNMAALADYERVIAAAPNFAWGHSAVAATEGFQLLNVPDGTEAAERRAAARGQAERALALDPHNGEAYLALELLAPRQAWRTRENLLLRGVAVDPSFEPTSLMEGRLLWGVGRGRDALTWLRSAHELNSLHNGANISLALSLASEGYPEESRALLKQMELQWPDHPWTQDARFWIEVVTGKPTEVLKLLDEPSRRPLWLDARAVGVWRAAMEASGSGSNAAAIRAARGSIIAGADGGWIPRGEATFLFAMLGDLDDAFVQARLYRSAEPILPPYLFLPAAAPLRADPRFMELAQRLGLVAYWRSSGRWPDFCSDPGVRYDCRAEAAKFAT